MMLVAWALAQMASASGLASPAPTLQAQFEQATAALTARKWDDALLQYRAIEVRPGISARTHSILLLREGLALSRLDRREEAKTSYRQGLALAPKTDASLADDRFEALIELGGIEQLDFDYEVARRDFEAAYALAGDATARTQALIRLVSVTMFDDNSAALRYAEELKVVATTNVSREIDATIHDLRARVLLNRGDYKGAKADLLIALKDLGGLTEHTDLNDVTVRADLALTSVLLKEMNNARDYSAMTGEGRMPEGPFAMAPKMDLPPCGGDLQPADDAVIEFGVGEDGSVRYANPVYASRSGPAARAFARAVSAWTWRPAEAAKIPAFYRLVTRIELRCSNAAERPADLTLLHSDVEQWLGAGDGEKQRQGTSAIALRAAIASEGSGANDPRRLIALLEALGNASTTDYEERQRTYERAYMLAAAQQAPGPVIAYFYIASVDLKSRMTRGAEGRYYAAVREMLARPDIAADAHSSAVMRLLLGAPRQGAGYAPDAGVALQAVVDDSRIGPRDPLKVGALVRLASFQAQAGQIDAARQTYLKTGLDAQQCSLVDAKPAVTKAGVGSGDYPMDMLALRVSGFTRIEFDILPDGQTANRRAVISYPPFAFGDETVKAMARTRFTQTYRPQGAIGCGGASQNFRYLVPSS